MESRPRPKPKPKAKAVTPADPGPSTQPRSEHAQLIPAPVTTNDEDELFMRNRKRTTATWQRLKDIDEKSKVEVIVDGVGEYLTAPKSKKKKPNEIEVPRWQRDKKLVRMLSEQVSDNSDNDILEVTNPNHSPVKKTTRKERSRSKSPTPPPAVSIQEIQKARNLVRQALETVPRAASPDFMGADDSTDDIVLNSELAGLAKSVAMQSLQPDTRYSNKAASQKDTVQITVKWQPHPKDVNGVSKVSAYRMNRDDAFHDLFDAAADDLDVLVQNLIMTYRGKRLFSSASPEALEIWGEAEFVAYDQTTYSYLQANHYTRESNLSSVDHHVQRTKDSADAIEINSDDDGRLESHPQSSSPLADTRKQMHESDAESEADDKFKIVLQSSLTQDKHITLTVRPRTKCGAIVKAFLKKAGVAEQYPHVFQDTASNAAPKKRGKKSQANQKDPRICIDGEKMSNDAEIGDADLEDGDMVEVVGL